MKWMDGSSRRCFVQPLPTLEEARKTFRAFIGDAGWEFDEVQEEESDCE